MGSEANNLTCNFLTATPNGWRHEQRCLGILRLEERQHTLTALLCSCVTPTPFLRCLPSCIPGLLHSHCIINFAANIATADTCY